MLEMMLDGPQVRHMPLANMTFLIVSYRPFLSLALQKKLCPGWNITLRGLLKLKTVYKVRVAATQGLGITERWSSEGLYRHLCVLQKLVPRAVRVCEI